MSVSPRERSSSTPVFSLLMLLAAGLCLAATPNSDALKLTTVADIPLGGHSTRLDYASLDGQRNLLFIAHLGDSEVIVFDTNSRTVVTRIKDISRVHGVLAIPQRGVVYASATGTNEVVAIDETTFKVIARMPGGVYPDGLAYSPETQKVYVSDEHGGTDTVLDVRTNQRVATVQIGGDIGNTQYDPTTRHMYVNAQSTSELVEIDPASDQIVRRLKVPGAVENHGLLIDPAANRAYIACQGNSRLIVLDLKRGTPVLSLPVARDPDVLALDADRGDLYVAGESGEVSLFKVTRKAVSGVVTTHFADYAHIVVVDPRSHEVYFPLQDILGNTQLKITRPER